QYPLVGQTVLQVRVIALTASTKRFPNRISAPDRSHARRRYGHGHDESRRWSPDHLRSGFVLAVRPAVPCCCLLTDDATAGVDDNIDDSIVMTSPRDHHVAA